MSSTGCQLALQTDSSPPDRRSLLAHLLHALNQPLTGLQCSLELAAAAPRTREEYVRALHEGLELTLRMRILVEAMRELADTEEEEPKPGETLRLDALVRETADDLRPVAETRKVRLRIAADVPLPVRSSRARLAALMLRFLESSLSMAREGSDFQVAAERERDQAVLTVSWSASPPPEHSPFSRSELGLLLARVAWERVGGAWLHTRVGDRQTCTVRLPLVSPPTDSTSADGES